MQAIAAAAGTLKVPLLVAAMGETTGAVHRRTLANAGVPVFASPEQAVRGFHHLVQDRRNRAAARELPPRTVLQMVPDRAEVRRAFRRARTAGRGMLTQDEGMAVLASYGVPVVPTRPAMGADDAAYAATLLGFPVALKRRRADRPDPSTKSGLVLDLRDADQVRAAADMLERRRSDRPDGESPGFVVQRQVGRARELQIRVDEDPVFGPIIGFGQGGTAAAFLRDIAVDLPPLNLPLARALIARTRVAATLGALHDQPAANVDAVADTLVRVSQLVVDFPEIAELDINPMFVDADGVLVADAWIRLRGEAEAPGRLAIPPYPSELTGTYTANGETLTIRPIRPEDAAAHGEFFRRLSPEDVRYRFFSAMRELSPEQIARLTQIDYEREMAFVAVNDTTGETVGRVATGGRPQRQRRRVRRGGAARHERPRPRAPPDAAADRLGPQPGHGGNRRPGAGRQPADARFHPQTGLLGPPHPGRGRRGGSSVVAGATGNRSRVLLNRPPGRCPGPHQGPLALGAR